VYLQSSKGFIAHFYAVSETVSPMLAWGFLGPEGPLKDMCYFFKVRVVFRDDDILERLFIHTDTNDLSNTFQ